MKKLIIIFLISMLPLLAISQSTTPDTKNWKHTGSNTFTKAPSIQGALLTGSNIVKYNAMLVDTGNIVDVIKATPFLFLPSQTSAVIATLTDLEEFTFVGDITRHVLIMWNGTEWRDITTTKSPTY